MKIMACGKEHELHVSPGADREAECNETIRKLVEHVEQRLCDLRTEKGKYGDQLMMLLSGSSLYSSLNYKQWLLMKINIKELIQHQQGQFDAYRKIKTLLDENGYYTDL